MDYNWDTSKRCPSFLEEPLGDELKKEPKKLEDFKVYIKNLLCGRHKNEIRSRFIGCGTISAKLKHPFGSFRESYEAKKGTDHGFQS